MVRRIGGVLLPAASLLLVFVGTVAAALPPGPRLAVVALRDPEWTQLFTVDPEGGARESLYSLSAAKAPSAVYPWSPPAWSPDGTRIAFTALDDEFAEFGSTGTSLAMISAEGGAPRPIPGTTNGFEPVFSPDGRTLAFALQREEEVRGHAGRTHPSTSVSIWLADLQTAKTRPLITAGRGDLYFPASFSPDGSRLAVSRNIDGGPSEAVAYRLDGRQIAILAVNAYEPIYSPDGSSIALLRGPRKDVTRHFPPSGRLHLSARLTDIFVTPASGGPLRRVTDTPRGVEEVPRWDPSGQLLAYTEWRPFDFGRESGTVQESVGFGFGKAVQVINADGTCPTTILSGLDSMYSAAVWQPGARPATPITC
jgi:Tol biopolymer transport system component